MKLLKGRRRNPNRRTVVRTSSRKPERTSIVDHVISEFKEMLLQNQGNINVVEFANEIALCKEFRQNAKLRGRVLSGIFGVWAAYCVEQNLPAIAKILENFGE